MIKPNSPLKDSAREVLEDIRRYHGNDRCADCLAPSKNVLFTLLFLLIIVIILDPEWVSTNVGVFICVDCAAIHKKLGPTVSKVSAINQSRFDEDLLKVPPKNNSF